MKPVKIVACTAALMVAALLGGVAAQAVKKDEKPAKPPADAPAFQMPQPGPEHEILKKDVGVWDATVETSMEPGGQTMSSKGVETNKLLGSGLWLVSEFKGEFAGQPFEGRGISGYNPMKKKYVGCWVDSMSTGLSLTESTYDPAKKTMTGSFEGPDESGKAVKMKTVSEWKDDGTRVFSMYMPTPDGKEFMGMRISYKRKAG